MIEHKPWIGTDYKTGINEQRIAIMGFSHHYDPTKKGDSEDFTVDTINCVIDEKNPHIQFFDRIINYFGFDQHEAFWNRVMFLNFLPDCVGIVDKRYGSGTNEQHIRARNRIERLIQSDDSPDKILVFTTKGWNSMPLTREEQEEDGACYPLGNEFPTKFSYGTYAGKNDHLVMVFGLQHPQFAKTELMQRAMRHILSMPKISL